jgi:hypothetical protein
MFVVVNKICGAAGPAVGGGPQLRLPYHIPYNA